MGAPITSADEGSAIEVLAGRVRLAARLSLADADRAVVVLAPGGPGTPADRYLARALRRAGFGTMVTDLLTEDEASCRHDVFDVALLAGRLRSAALWLHRQTGLPYAYLAADTGAAAALEAVAPGLFAIVSRGGRPDLASPAALAGVRVPVLFVVGSLDTRVLGLSRLAVDWMRCEHRIAVVPGATHLLTGVPALAAVADLALDWLWTRSPQAASGARPSPV
ncbi:alpha/beta hydrolase [Streptomyces sp. NPDC014006]|uniref:alpha/beta hydrolase n=1 Tax=Streptomyces sp. NPDC014006 TaxID=3364870 RepID=UPI0036F5EBF0